MKLLFENWRQYLAESEKAKDYGYLYLFEGDTVRKTSFYGALNLLSENENAIETFLENWERSVDYHIEQIDEAAIADMASNPILYLSTQAFMLLDRVKEKAVKYAGKILGVINKVRGFLSRFEEKHPTLYKMGTFAIKIVVAILVIYAVSHIFGGGDAQAGNLVGAPEFEGGEIVQKVIANEDELRKIGEAASNVEGLEDVGKEILNIANSPDNFQGGIGGDISQKAQKVIEHSLKAMESATDGAQGGLGAPEIGGQGGAGAPIIGGQTAMGAPSDLAAQNTRIFKPMIDAAKAAAEGAEDSLRVTRTVKGTMSDPAAAKKAKQAADIAKQAGLK